MTTKRQLRAEVGRLTGELEDAEARLRSTASVMDVDDAARRLQDTIGGCQREVMRRLDGVEARVDGLAARVALFDGRLPALRVRKPAAKKKVAKKVVAVKSAKQRARKPTKR